MCMIYETVESTPAVGQYDISKATSAHAGAVFFPKDKRFKESQGRLLICSAASRT